MAWTTPRTWVPSEVVTAALLNTQLRDNLLALTDLTTTWVPTWSTTGTAPAIGNGSLIGRYIDTGDLCTFMIHLTAGSTTTFGTGSCRFDLPVGEVARRFAVLGTAFDTSLADDYPLHVVRTGSDQLTVKCDSTTAGAAVRSVTVTTPFAWATGDELYISGTYEKV